jgi:hypothetical protein
VIGAWWGIAGVLFVLGRAIVRLVPQALMPLRDGPTAGVLALYAASVLFNGYVEGYRAFHKGFAPRVAARALHLRTDRSLLHAVLAPLFIMAMFHATRRRLIARYVLVFGLVILIWAVRHTPQPWRGIIDAGVVIALSWGCVSLLYYFVRGLRGRPPPASADLPESVP